MCCVVPSPDHLGGRESEGGGVRERERGNVSVGSKHTYHALMVSALLKDFTVCSLSLGWMHSLKSSR